jgi:predicted Co/Zn/Cd cation transporter (cation efflux family)
MDLAHEPPDPGSAPRGPDPDPARREARALRLSAAAGLALAVLGIAWGLAADSAIILFDGLYSIVGFLLSWLGLRAAALVEAGPTPHYPFGREALAPLVVTVQALVLLGTFGYAAIDAVGVILDGGSQTEVGSALVYSILTLAACVVVRAALARQQAGSDLVAAEVAQWAASVVLGVLMVVGFGIAVALGSTVWSGFAPFVDPVLVLVAAAVILPTPVRMLRQAFRELLEGAPDAEVAAPIHAAIGSTVAEFGLPAPTTRLGKLGRKVYLELDFVVAEDGGWTVDDADRIRRRLMQLLSRPGQLLWINVELHTDPAWDS